MRARHQVTTGRGTRPKGADLAIVTMTGASDLPSSGSMTWVTADGGLDGSAEGPETAADRLRRLLAPAGIAGTEVDGAAERDAAGGR